MSQGRCPLYFVAYVVDEDGEPIDGDTIATGLGWSRWIEWAAELDDCPHAAHLAEEGWIEPAAALEALAEELEAMLDRDHPGKDLVDVTHRLLAAVKARPEGCLGLVITDGTEGGDEEDEDEED